jgi:hypothetical protein
MGRLIYLYAVLPSDRTLTDQRHTAPGTSGGPGTAEQFRLLGPH